MAQVSRLSILEMSVPGIKQQVLSPSHQIFIWKIVVLSQLRQFWDTIWSELANKSPYTASIRVIKMKLPKFHDNDKEAKKLRSE